MGIFNLLTVLVIFLFCSVASASEASLDLMSLLGPKYQAMVSNGLFVLAGITVILSVIQQMLPDRKKRAKMKLGKVIDLLEKISSVGPTIGDKPKRLRLPSQE